MRAFASCVVAVAALGCSKVPVRDIYCDGTTRWPCADPAYPVCDSVARRCVAAPDLSAPSPPDLASPDLARCHASADCAAATPICGADGTCRACASSADDGDCAARASATPRCATSGAAAGTCVACNTPGVQSSDCAAPTPVCAADDTCRPCLSHDECSSRICNLDGTCASGSIAYADNAGGTCTGSHAATLADPACDIGAAMSVAPTVRVIGSSAAYGKLAIASGTIRIVGPGGTATPSARVSGDLTSPALTVGGATTSVTLDGLEISGGGTGQDGIFCSQASLGPSLTMTRTWIHGVGGIGVDATKCTVILDRDTIGPGNTGGGIVLTGAQFTITNTFIEANGAAAAGVTFNTGATAIAPGFAHDTVVKNSGGGVACNVATTILNSIIWSNMTNDTTGSCTLAGSITPPAPDFVNVAGPSYDLHLAGRTTNNVACCIDQIASSPVTHDFDGRARPQPAGGRWDVGAHEVP